MANSQAVEWFDTKTVHGPEAENRFFVAMSLLLLATVLVGFAKSYFLAGLVRAPLPNKLIHVHAVLFSSWILLLIAQASFISTSKFALHRKFGLFGFGLACGMCVIGVMAATDSMTRLKTFGSIDIRTFYAVPMFDILVFATLIFFAYRWRHDPATHKRLILIASITLVDAATGRDPLTKITHLPYLNNIFTQLYTVLIAGFDFWCLKRIHRATLLAGTFSIVMLLLAIPIGRTGPWMAFANWMMGLAKAVK
ncbi:MAG TPA: hypothetical protein VJN93_06525 [Candidatus Acidoferrum sp.]|nr:hypothetical protein [Candidatus Acidoferrum sp.]